MGEMVQAYEYTLREGREGLTTTETAVWLGRAGANFGRLVAGQLEGAIGRGESTSGKCHGVFPFLSCVRWRL